MPINYYRDLCTRYRNRAVEIRTRDGRRHRGIIYRLERDRVFLRPLGDSRGLRGFAYGFGGYGGLGGFGGYGGYGGGIAFGAIAAIALYYNRIREKVTD